MKAEDCSLLVAHLLALAKRQGCLPEAIRLTERDSDSFAALASKPNFLEIMVDETTEKDKYVVTFEMTGGGKKFFRLGVEEISA